MVSWGRSRKHKLSRNYSKPIKKTVSQRERVKIHTTHKLIKQAKLKKKKSIATLLACFINNLCVLWMLAVACYENVFSIGLDWFLLGLCCRDYVLTGLKKGLNIAKHCKRSNSSSIFFSNSHNPIPEKLISLNGKITNGKKKNKFKFKLGQQTAYNQNFNSILLENLRYMARVFLLKIEWGFAFASSSFI